MSENPKLSSHLNSDGTIPDDIADQLKDADPTVRIVGSDGEVVKQFTLDKTQFFTALLRAEQDLRPNIAVLYQALLDESIQYAELKNVEERYNSYQLRLFLGALSVANCSFENNKTAYFFIWLAYALCAVVCAANYEQIISTFPDQNSLHALLPAAPFIITPFLIWVASNVIHPDYSLENSDSAISERLQESEAKLADLLTLLLRDQGELRKVDQPQKFLLQWGQAVLNRRKKVEQDIEEKVANTQREQALDVAKEAERKEQRAAVEKEEQRLAALREEIFRQQNQNHHN